jgi:methyltransferase-like protein/cyclopropane fatty-acyl-phospholipid synthase-like methyltransferase
MSEFSYDVTQYTSHPYAQSHPEHLSLLGEMFGLKPKPWKKARILELGCAAGGNIIPLAMEAPEAEIVGIDLSKLQIDDGQIQVKELGLTNVKLEHRSIMDINKDDGLFDYVIAHGVWSWVPEAVRQQIFGIIRNNMSDQGVAYVSYNTFPGWNMVLNVRDMMKFHALGFATHAEKAQQARLLLKFVVDGLQNDTSPYANFLRNEIQLISKQTDNYILHEYLEEENHPVYFHQFIDQAQKFDLSYLSDTYLPDMFAYNLPEQFAKEIGKIENIIRANQYIDFIKNRRFRCTLLSHNHNKINRQLSFDKIKDYYFTYSGSKTPNIDEKTLDEGTPMGFGNGLVTLTVKSKISKTAMWLLQNQKGKPLTFKALCQMTMRQMNSKNFTEVQNHLINDLNMLRLILGGLVTLHSSEGNYTITLKDTPKVSKLASYQIQKRHYVTNQRHQLVALTPVEQSLIKEIDGKQTISQISEKLTNLVLNGEIKIQREDGTQITDNEDIKRRMPALCEDLLEKFAEHALLID